MKVLIDACVLYPTVMREIVVGAARAGVFEPFWSDRILREWTLAVEKLGPVQVDVAKGEVALLRANWPDATVAPDMALERQLYLPDEDDTHVLAAAITTQADALLTMNLRDFPRRTLADHNIMPMHPDAFLMAELPEHHTDIADVVEAVRQMAEKLSGEPQDTRKLLKKARLPRLGKALGA